MDRITNKTKHRKTSKFTKRKLVIILVIILALVGILFLVNRLIPVKNISKDNIGISLSTIKPTGQNVVATITSKTKYDILYYIDYSAGEEKYYESSEESDDEANKELEIKEIKDKQYKKLNGSKFEIENNGIIYLKYGRFGKLSSIPYVFEVSNIDKDGPEIVEISTESTYNSITVTTNASDKNDSNLQYYFKLSESDMYISTGSKNSYTFKDLTTDESYVIFIKVTDQFGNESEAVTEAVASVNVEPEETVVQKVYHFKVNLSANTVTVYEQDENGKFTNPIKAFVCSTGKATPKSGTYKISNKYRWRSLFGNVYGQYAVRITGNILFHSVPYEKMYPNTLEYEEYDKLGTSASMGCVRLCVRDAKWIYDNAKSGSTVEFYSNSSNPGPLGKPKAQKISSNKANRNWDPTDPDKHNPWLGGDGKVSKSVIYDDGDYIDTNTVSNSVKNEVQDDVSNAVANTVENSVENVTNSPDINNNRNEQTKPSSGQEDPPNTNTLAPSTNTTAEPPSEQDQNTVNSGSDTDKDDENENSNTTVSEPEQPPVEDPSQRYPLTNRVSYLGT